MNTIHRHFPGSVDRDPAADDSVEFDTMDQLLAIPWVAQWKANHDFHRFSVSRGAMMAELKGGREWWVIGHLDRAVAGLPKWEGTP